MFTCGILQSSENKYTIAAFDSIDESLKPNFGL